MPETDIYKQREPMPFGNKPPEKKRQRRKSSKRSFDDHSRKRRSKNSGVRRLLHLSRKSDNEKLFWISIGTAFVVIIVIAGIWQFVIQEYMIRSEETQSDYLRYHENIPEYSPAEQTSEAPAE